MAGQNIKTNYTSQYDKDKQREALKHHAERREINREIRDTDQLTKPSTKTYTKGEEKAIKKYDDAKLKAKQNPPKKPEPTKAEKAKAWLKERSQAIAHNTRDIRPPRGSVYGAVGMGLPANPDLFGVGGFGSIHGVMRSDPFQEMQPRRPPAPAPQRKKKRKRKSGHRAPPQSGGMPPMMGIPSHMKWMFGQ